jgi:hypothetical protein
VIVNLFNQFINDTFVTRNRNSGELKMRYENTDLDFADFTEDDERALADMDREIRTEARRAQLRQGDRVKIKFQHHRVGVLMEILPGCNVLARVQFEGDSFTVLLPLSDLIKGGQK